MNEAQEIEQLDGLAEEVRITRLAPAPGALLPRRARRALPVRAASAIAAGGFVAGAALVGVLGRRQRRAGVLAASRRRSRLPGRRGRGGGARGRKADAERLQIVGSRKLLIDVHLLGSPGPDR